MFYFESFVTSMHSFNSFEAVPFSMQEAVRHHKNAASVTKHLAPNNIKLSAELAKQLMLMTRKLAIHHFLFPEGALIKKVLLFSAPQDEARVFIYLSDERIFTCTIKLVGLRSDRFFSFIKALAIYPEINPTPEAVKAVASATCFAVDFDATAAMDIRRISDTQAARSLYKAISASALKMLDSLVPFNAQASLNAECRMRRLYLRDALTGFKRFFSGLDSALLAVVRPNSLNGAICYNYYRARTFHESVNRRQAAASFPIIATLLPHWRASIENAHSLVRFGRQKTGVLGMVASNNPMNGPKNTPDSADPLTIAHKAIVEAVDFQKSLTDEICSTFSISLSATRSLRHCNEEFPSIAGLDDLCFALNNLPPDFRPKTSEDFRQFQSLYNAMRMFSIPADIPPDERNDLAISTNMLIIGWLRPVARECTRHGWRAVVDSINIDQEKLDRFSKAICGLVAKPYLGEEEARYRHYFPLREKENRLALPMVLRLLKTMSFIKLLRMIDSWTLLFPECRRQAEQELSKDARRGRGYPIYPVIIRKPWFVGDMVVVPLLSGEDIVAEGRAMRHCAGTFTAFATSGLSFLFSIRQASGTRISTFELTVDNEVLFKPSNANGDSHPFQLKQHFGELNSIPSRAVRCIAEYFVRAANAEQFDFSLRGALSRIRRMRMRKISSSWEDKALIAERTSELVFERVTKTHLPTRARYLLVAGINHVGNNE